MEFVRRRRSTKQGTLRSLKMMALTTTCTSETLQIVKDWLSMTDPTIIALCSHRFNIFYSVKSAISLDQLSSNVVEQFSKGYSAELTKIAGTCLAQCDIKWVKTLLNHQNILILMNFESTGMVIASSFAGKSCFLFIFKATNHRNYAKEAVQLLIQYNYFSERMKFQLLWSQCINTKGRTGCNIACDLHMEHLNRTPKTVSMGAYIYILHLKQLCKLRSQSLLYTVCVEFEQETCSDSTSSSDIHNIPSFGKYFETVLKLLID